MVSDPRVGPLLNRLGGLYRDPNRVDRDASSLLKSSVGKHLTPNISSLVENNGASFNTLCLKGTISIHFRGQEYQQLMEVFLPPGYPVRPPTCFVRLANPNMYLKENHPHVGSDGQVYLPYLHEWRPHNHSLIEMVVAMSSVFSNDPPVFTRATPQPPPPPPVASTTSRPTPAYNAATVASSYSSYNSSNNNEDEILQQTLQASAAEEEERRRKEEKAKQVAAQEAWDAKAFSTTKEKVRRKIVQRLTENSGNVQNQIQTDMMDQKKLTLSQERLTTQISTLTKQKEELEKQNKVVDEAIENIQQFLATAEKNKESEQEVSVDDTVVPTSAVDEQMLQLASENASYGDALYFLDKALHNRIIDLPTHLKEVRKVAKKQFLIRAHLVKISQVRGMTRGSF